MRPFLGIALALSALAVACGGGDATTPTPSGVSPAASAAPSASATPAATPAVPSQPLTIGPETDFPDDTALILETGCWQCDGPATGLIRVYRDPAGNLRTDTLLSDQSLGLGPRVIHTFKGVEEVEPYFTGIAVAPDGSRIIAGVCIRESCGTGGLDAWSADSRTILLESSDGGVTWRQIGELSGGGAVIGLVGTGVLVATYPAELAAAHFMIFPDGATLEPPPGAENGWPFTSSGEVYWQRGGNLLRGDSSEFLTLPGESPQIYRATVLGNPTGTGLALAWIGGENDRAAYLGFFDQDAALLKTYSTSGLVVIGAWPQVGVVYGNVDVSISDLTTEPPPPPGFFLGWLPAAIDPDTGIANPIAHPFLDKDYQRGRNIVRAAMRGTFLRIKTGELCLNLRAAPDPTAPVIDCAADGVLLRLGIGNAQYPGGVYEIGGRTWLSALTPDGHEGFVDAAYVER